MTDNDYQIMAQSPKKSVRSTNTQQNELRLVRIMVRITKRLLRAFCQLHWGKEGAQRREKTTAYGGGYSDDWSHWEGRAAEFLFCFCFLWMIFVLGRAGKNGSWYPQSVKQILKEHLDVLNIFKSTDSHGHSLWFLKDCGEWDATGLRETKWTGFLKKRRNFSNYRTVSLPSIPGGNITTEY